MNNNNNIKCDVDKIWIGQDHGLDHGPDHGLDHGSDHGSDQGKKCKNQNFLSKLH